MAAAFNILILLIAAGPVFAAYGKPFIWAVQLIAIAIGLSAVSLSSRQVDLRHLAAASDRVRGILLLPLLLIVTQLLPLPLSWSHPIWTSAAEALPSLTNGHMTVDVNCTAQAFLSALAWIAVTIMSVAVTRDRQRAEGLLLTASAITTFFSAIALIQNVMPIGSLRMVSRDAALAFGEFGIILNTAVIFFIFEPREVRRKGMQRLPMGLGGGVAILIHAISLNLLTDESQWTAAGLGVAILLMLLTIRKLALPHWTIGVFYTAALITIGLAVAWLFNQNPAATGLLRFIPSPAADTLGVLERMIGDGRWLGSGANTFEVLVRIYQSSETLNRLQPPTSAIQLLVETGWVGILLFVLSGLAIFTKLFWGALERGRDWIFPATAAASIAVFFYSGLMTADLVQMPITSMLAVIVGMGLSQGFSHNERY